MYVCMHVCGQSVHGPVRKYALSSMGAPLSACYSRPHKKNEEALEDESNTHLALGRGARGEGACARGHARERGRSDPRVVWVWVCRCGCGCGWSGEGSAGVCAAAGWVGSYLLFQLFIYK